MQQAKKQRSIRDKTHRTTDGEVLVFGPLRNSMWPNKIAMNVRRTPEWAQVLLTPAQARRLAADLIRRAEWVERESPSTSGGTE